MEKSLSFSKTIITDFYCVREESGREHTALK